MGVQAMAARISASAVDFAAVAVKIPAAQKQAFAALQNKVQTHLRKVNSLPAEPPAIDFDAYKAKVTVPGMVDDFAAKYAALQIPYPSDQGTLAAIDAQAVEQKAAVAAFCAESNARIEGIKVELGKWEEMNREEALDAGLIGTTIIGIPNPDVPSFWPHRESWDDYVARLKAAEDEEAH